MNRIPTSLALVAAAMCMTCGVKAAILDLVDPFDQIRAFTLFHPGLSDEDIVANVPFGSAGGVQASFGAGQDLLYTVTQSYALPVAGPVGAATSLSVDTASSLSGVGGGTGAGGDATGRIFFSLTTSARYSVSGFTTFVPVSPPTGTNPNSRRTTVQLLNILTSAFAYSYDNQTSSGGMDTHTLGDGGTGPGSENGPLSGILPPGDYSFFWRHQASRGTDENEADFHGEVDFSLVAVPVPGAIVLLGSSVIVLLGIGRRRVPRASRPPRS